MMRSIGSFEELEAATGGLKGPAIVAFFADFSQKSRQAWPVFQSFVVRHPERVVYTVDVGVVKDVHRRLGVTHVPTVIALKDGAVAQQVMGVNTLEEYEAALVGPSNAPAGRAASPGRSPHRVVVYTGAMCPWCTRVKAYLRQREVPFTEIDVSLEPHEATALVRKTGQTGVPQLDIDGQYVVGFDKARIDALLGLAPQASRFGG